MTTSYRNEISKRTIRNAPQGGKHHGEGPSDGAQRNARVASFVAARKAAREDDKEKKIADRTAAAEKRKKETLAMATEEKIDEIFGFGRKKTNTDNKLERFPDSHKAKDWMTAKLNHELKHNPKDAHRLFSPASGDYMPLNVHVGSSWKKEHQDHYRDLKKKHPDLVQKAKKDMERAGAHSQSRVGDPEDFHGVKLAEESLTEELHPDYKLVKTGKKSTGAHPDGKPIYDVHHKGEKVATLSPISAYKDKKIPGKRYVASRKDITKYAIDSNANGLRFNSHNRYHNNAKDATEYFVQQHQQALKEESFSVTEETQTHIFHAHIKPLHKDDKVSKVVLKVKASNKNEATNKASKHLAKNYGVGNVSSVVHKGIMEETGTEARTKIKNVARPGDADPMSKDSTLVKTGEIKKKKIDEGRSMSINRNFGLSDSLIAATRALLEKKEDADDDIKSVGTGKGKTEVDTKPQTDDQVNDGDDAPEKKSKKKLDPVGKEDDDVDNDGDTDKSDKYLKNRRKAISKAVKEEVEEVDEAFTAADLKKQLQHVARKEKMLPPGISAERKALAIHKEKLTKAHNKAMGMKEEAEQIDELKHSGILSRYIKAVKHDVDDDVASPKRKAGYHMALKKKWGDKKYGFDEPRVKATNEDLDEAIKPYVSYTSPGPGKKPSATVMGPNEKPHKTFTKDEHGHDYKDKALEYFKKNFKSIKEAEQIDELKKSTLASYTKKASNDATKHSYMAGKTGDVDTAAKASKRIRGIDMATNKLAKEEFSDAELARLEEIAAKFS